MLKNKYIMFASIALSVLAGYFLVKFLIRKRNTQKEEIEGSTEIGTQNFDINSEINYSDTAGTEHFKLSEFDCNDGTEVPNEYKGNVQKLMEQLEIIRAAAGNKPIYINSGYRTPSHNAAVGGVSNSQHLVAKAADITISGMTPLQVYNLIDRLTREGKIMQGGLGSYPTFTHYDIRGTKSRWNG